MSDDRDTKAYKNARADLLRDSPMCHWCGKAPATEADHLVPVMDGGTHRDGMVPSCKPCNSRRGAQDLNRKTAQRMQKRTAAVTDSLGSQVRTPPSLIRENLSEGQDVTILGPDGTDLPIFGRTEPRLITPVVGAESFGPLVSRWASSVLGISLMPWQETAINGQLSKSAEGSGTDLMFTSSLVETARQQGKSVALKSLAGWWATEFAQMRGQPQFVLLVANRLERASAMLRELAPIMEAKFGAKAFWSFGRESITFADGSMIKVSAASGTAHGMSIDLCLIDELWSVGAEAVFSSFKPAMIARRSPLMSMWSTAGDETSTVMQQIESQGINDIDQGKVSKLFFASWSPPPGVNTADRAWWPWANPALGHTITWDALESAYQMPDKAKFMRAHLNLWVSAAQSWLPFGLWADRLTTEPMPAGGWLCCDSALDDSRYVGVRAAPTSAGTIVTVAFMVDTESAMWAEVNRIMADPTIQLGVTPTLEIHTPPDLRRRTITVGYGELLKYTALVRNMIIEGKLWHTGEISLAEHVTRSVMAKSSVGVALSSKKSPGPIELCRSMVWAAALASKPTTKGKPAFAAR